MSDRERNNLRDFCKGPPSFAERYWGEHSGKPLKLTEEQSQKLADAFFETWPSVRAYLDSMKRKPS